MKRLLAFCLLLCIAAVHCIAADIYVAVNGADDHDGTRTQPLASVAAAVRKARELRRLHDPSVTGGIHIILGGGTYFLNEAITLRPEDSGTPDSPTFIEAAPGEAPVISGGFLINQWHKLSATIPGLPTTARGKVWVATVHAPNGNTALFRQLWVNGTKAVRAKTGHGADMQRILSWNKQSRTCTIPVNGKIPFQEGMELFIHQWWEIAILRIKKIQQQGDSAVLWFHEPESTIQSEHPWPAPWLSKETGNSAFYLTNAMAFLDEPGEWWFDIKEQKIYYWPRQQENMLHAAAVAPAIENLLRITGSMERPVKNIVVRGISFQYSNWTRPSLYGHVPHQAGMYMTEAYKLIPAGADGKASLDNQAWTGRPAAAIQVSYADHTVLTGCSFLHLASTGVDYAKFTHDNTIEGSLFKDIGGNALLAGVFSEEGSEVHIPYQPSNEADVCSNTIIKNNFIDDAANEDWGCVGIGLGYTRNSQVVHNEVNDVSYTAISDGWGWTKSENAMRNNLILANRVTHYGKHNYDCAGIYTLSNQPGTVIAENTIDSIYQSLYAHLPMHWFYLYTDEGSSNITVRDNWCPSEKFLQNANGPGNSWVNNGPRVDVRIKDNAGLEPAYRHLRAAATIDRSIPINKEQPVIVELVFPADGLPDKQKFIHTLQSMPVREAQWYRWNNRVVIFGYFADLRMARQHISNDFPLARVKLYDNIYYAFDRSRCGDTATAGTWKHIILSANLVADPHLQQEYLHYHAVQFTQWPEVAQGFCQARFQRLLGYKNGRQLMLVISIPEKESLDKLNPETVRNNPRMQQWNALMKKYQEGIAGTKPGETWVFFEPQ